MDAKDRVLPSPVKHVAGWASRHRRFRRPPVSLGTNTKQSCWLLIANFADWSPIIVGDEQINFYTMIPIYREERDFEKKHGLHPLLERFNNLDISTVVDVERENIGKVLND